jgi:hypothetical protein
MLVQFSDRNGSPLYINPQSVIAVRQEKHFGRPGVGASDEYHDTLVLTTKGDFNVQDSPDDVVREINRALAVIEPPKPPDTAAGGSAEGEA